MFTSYLPVNARSTPVFMQRTFTIRFQPGRRWRIGEHNAPQSVRTDMKYFAILPVIWLAAFAGTAAAADEPKPALPDPDYCSRRDADPEKCVIQDGPPPRPIVRKKPPVIKTPPVQVNPTTRP